MPRRLDELGEHGWIATVVRRLGGARGAVRLGPGDDAAALRVGSTTLLVTTDTLIDWVHFRRGWLSPRALGERAFRVSASDIAAMGGNPLAAVMALEVPRGTPVATLDGIVAGFVADARRHGAHLLGGNVARAAHLAITVTMLGRAGRRLVTRSGARPGDVVCVTGALGATGTAVRRRLAGQVASLPRVPDRIGAGTLLAAVASAMIDVSDGLAQDLGHVCRASGVAMRIDATLVPVAAACRRRFGDRATAIAATAGEDYELAFTVSPRRVPALIRRLGRLGCRVTPIGAVVAGRPSLTLVDARGRVVRLPQRGFDHLRLAGRRSRG
ncbi:MAG: thiamine-phosphate kinase [Candidatus Binatia bacterium]